VIVDRKPEEINCDDLRTFLSELVEHIKMNALFEPIAIDGKFGFTGMVGIVTSHIAFHYYDGDSSLHLDVYSCKAYDLEQLVKFINAYWRIVEGQVIFIDRDNTPSISKYSISKEGQLLTN
jgi:S-adenosylmethionine decarboxylase